MSDQQSQAVRPRPRNSEKTVSELLVDLRDPDALIRQEAARALGDASESDNETVKARLLIALHDEQEIVRRAAADGLEKLGQIAITTRSGGVNIDAQSHTIAGDVVGREKIVIQIGGVNADGERIDVGGDVVGRDKIAVLNAQVDDEGRAASAYLAGVRLVEQNHWYDGLALLEESLRIRRRLNDLNARADTIYQIAYTHHLIGNLDKARTHYRDALRLYEYMDNQRGVAACQSALGYLMTQNGFIDEAIDDLKTARRIYRTLGHKQEASKVGEILQLAARLKEKQLA
jgi:tetratricopeptide (TPR) repeat protein